MKVSDDEGLQLIFSFGLEKCHRDVHRVKGDVFKCLVLSPKKTDIQFIIIEEENNGEVFTFRTRKEAVFSELLQF